MHWSVDVEARAGAFRLDVCIEGNRAPVVLIGPNGSGKTTLLRIIVGAYRPQTGRIHIGDRLLFDSEAGISLPPEERRIGYVPQGYGLFPHLSVLDNVAFGLAGRPPRMPRSERLQMLRSERQGIPRTERQGIPRTERQGIPRTERQGIPRTERQSMPRTERRRTAAGILAEMECEHLVPRYPATLSGGEKQRVALARALLPAPEMLLLDEPLAAMDVAARRGLRAYLARRLARRAKPAIVVTHDVRDVHALGSPVVVALEGGRVVQSGSPATMTARPATDFVAEFFGAA